jgi:prepilin-type N-terminal cleavage/methylation domain-containing protein
MPLPSARRKRHTKGTRGLTLIELMIGLAICAVLLSLAVPSFQAYLQRNRLKAAALGLELALREARWEAARRSQAVHLVFKTGADWCYALTTNADCDCKVQQPCRLKTVRGSDLRGVQLLQSHDARFDPNGAADWAGQAALWQAVGPERVRVTVSALGRPAVCVLDGALPPLPGC